MTSRSRPLVLALVLSFGCNGDDDGDSAGATSQSGTSASGSASAEDGPEPTCEPNGGTCSCAGGCNPGYVLAPSFTCPQPPDSSGACSLECCMPETETSTAASSSGGPVCDCGVLPVCMTPEGEDCGGMYPQGRCCDESGMVFRCSCIEPCTGGYPCCVLSEGCA